MEDNSHSLVRISHGLNKLVTDLSNKEDNDNEQETSGMKFEDFAIRSKAKAKPRRRTLACSSTRTVLISERYWTDIEPEILFVYRLHRVQTIEYSSAWTLTSRRRWCD